MCCEFKKLATKAAKGSNSQNERVKASLPGRTRRAAGFTLVEIMIVVVIIGLLAGMVSLNVRGILAKSKQNVARQEIATIVQALTAYQTAYGRYPTNEDGLAVLCRSSDKFPDSLLDKGKALNDPWGRPYQYNCPGASSAFEVISYGADGREGGDGGDADISSEKLKE